MRSRFRLAVRHYERLANHHRGQVIFKPPNFDARFNSLCFAGMISLHCQSLTQGTDVISRLVIRSHAALPPSLDLILSSTVQVHFQLFWLWRQIVNMWLQIFRLEHSDCWKDFPPYRFGSWRQVTTTRVWEDAGAGVVVCRALGSSSCDGHVEEEEYQLGPSVAQQGAGYTFQSSKLSCSLKSGRS